MCSMEQKMNYRKPYSAFAKNCVIFTSFFRILSYENMSYFLIFIFYTLRGWIENDYLKPLVH